MNSCNESVKLLTRSEQKLKPTEDKRLSAKETLLAFTRHTQAGLPHELAPQDAGEDAGPDGGGELPPADGLHAAAARQERTGEPPLSGLMLGQDPDLRLFAASHTHELAVAMNRDVQRVMDHEHYRDLYPEVRLATPRSPRGLFLPRRTMGFFEIAGY